MVSILAILSYCNAELNGGNFSSRRRANSSDYYIDEFEDDFYESKSRGSSRSSTRDISISSSSSITFNGKRYKLIATDPDDSSRKIVEDSSGKRFVIDNGKIKSYEDYKKSLESDDEDSENKWEELGFKVAEKAASKGFEYLSDKIFGKSDKDKDKDKKTERDTSFYADKDWDSFYSSSAVRDIKKTERGNRESNWFGGDSDFDFWKSSSEDISKKRSKGSTGNDNWFDGEGFDNWSGSSSWTGSNYDDDKYDTFKKGLTKDDDLDFLDYL